ncbi:hypothetical protein [Streptomyces sp. NPDC016172]|uniref:hypothetical protein n=1 Tax=Streptomyces sp. NPDC016172 TaxID=3364964 RepID=UPI0036F5A0B5
MDSAVTIGLDGVLAAGRWDKQDAAPASTKTGGHHPLTGFADHGPAESRNR